MTDPGETIDTTELAAALGWQAERLDLLVRDEQVQSEVRSLCTLGAVLREGTPTTEGFQSNTLEALRRDGMGKQAPSPVLVSNSPSITSVVAGGLTFAFASIATVLALMATGVQQTGISPLAVMAAGLVVGALATAREIRQPVGV